MIYWKKGRVTKIIESHPDLQEIEVDCEGVHALAWNYPGLTGKVYEGDQVYLNTTAVKLGLGSGGYHFVIANLSRYPVNVDAAVEKTGGHIMKMRYTPLQAKVLSSEEESSPYHSAIVNFSSLSETPVIIGTLHSMLAPAAGGCLAVAGKSIRIAYVMTDGAALPMPLSRVVRDLKKKGILCGTVSVGNAFGGDIEAVNIYSGLIAAYVALKADVIIVTMGPGIVGTGTKWGTTALEQGEIINAVNVLGGRPVAIPRISFADPRPRHFGVSHHTLTALGTIALTPAIVALPEMPEVEDRLISEQLKNAGVFARHKVLVSDGRKAIEYLDKAGISVKSMGRGLQDDPFFFYAAGAAGEIAARLLNSSISERFEGGEIIGNGTGFEFEREKNS